MKRYFVDVRNLQSESEKNEVLAKFDLGGWTYWAPKYQDTNGYTQIKKILYAEVTYDLEGEPIFPDIPSNCKITTYKPSL